MNDAEAAIAVKTPFAIERRQAAKPHGHGSGRPGDGPENLDATEGLVSGKGTRQRSVRFAVKIFGHVAKIAAENVGRLGADDFGERRGDLSDLVRGIRAPEKAHMGPRADLGAEHPAHFVELPNGCRPRRLGRRGLDRRLLARQERAGAEHGHDIEGTMRGLCDPPGQDGDHLGLRQQTET